MDSEPTYRIFRLGGGGGGGGGTLSVSGHPEKNLRFGLY